MYVRTLGVAGGERNFVPRHETQCNICTATPLYRKNRIPCYNEIFAFSQEQVNSVCTERVPQGFFPTWSFPYEPAKVKSLYMIRNVRRLGIDNLSTTSIWFSLPQSPNVMPGFLLCTIHCCPTVFSSHHLTQRKEGSFHVMGLSWRNTHSYQQQPPRFHPRQHGLPPRVVFFPSFFLSFFLSHFPRREQSHEDQPVGPTERLLRESLSQSHTHDRKIFSLSQ